jgi:hypothetical protein
LSRGVIVVVLYDKKIKNSFEDLLNKEIITIINYDIDNLSKIELNQINEDFKLIKKCLLDGKPTQSGQKYLHIHRHSNGGKNNTRAFGFTNKFLTKLVAKCMNFEFVENNRNYYIIY